MRTNGFCLTVLAAVALTAVPLSASAQTAGTAFAYQGRLTDGGSPANGDYDFEFTLCQDEAGTSLVAGPISAVANNSS